MKCYREGCDQPSYLMFHHKEKDIARYSCMDHYFDIAGQFEKEITGHPHMRYIAYCPACTVILEKSQTEPPTMRSQPKCKIHPTVGLRLFPMNAEHIFKECVWEDK